MLSGVFPTTIPRSWSKSHDQAENTSYRRQLLSLKKHVGGELSALEQEALRPVGGEASGGLSNVPLDPADLGSDNYEEEISLGLLENADQVVREIDDARQRIEQGNLWPSRCCHKGSRRSGGGASFMCVSRPSARGRASVRQVSELATADRWPGPPGPSARPSPA